MYICLTKRSTNEEKQQQKKSFLGRIKFLNLVIYHENEVVST